MEEYIDYCYDHHNVAIPRELCEICRKNQPEFYNLAEMCLEHNMPRNECYGCRNDLNTCIHGNKSFCFMCINNPKKCPHGKISGCQICQIYGESPPSRKPFIPEKTPITPFGSPAQ